MYSLRSLFTVVALALAGAVYAGAQTSSDKPATATYRQAEDKHEPGPHFARALELYELGPSKAAEIIAELDLELREHPNDLEALLLKARTQMGIDRLDAALATLDQLASIAAKTETIHPGGIFLRARILFYKEEYVAAKRTLEPFSAFFQGNDKNKSQYDSLMAAITAKIQKSNEK